MLKRLTLIESLVVLAIVATLAGAILAAWHNPGAYHFAPDGTTIYSVEIDGHDYLKAGATLTHSASCKACTQRER